MRVLVLSGATYADPSNRRTIQHIAARGVEVLLAMPRHARYIFAPVEVPDTPWPTPGVTLARLDTWYLHEKSTHIAMKGVSRLIREFAPDIIHCVMEPWSITSLQVLAATRAMSPRPVFGVQAGETKPEQGGVVARFIRRGLYRHVLARSDFFIGWSTPAIQAATRMGLNGQVTCVAPGVGVDPKEFRALNGPERAMARGECGIPEADAFVVGYAGRLVEEKGVFDLIEAMDKVATTQSKVRLVIVGDGPCRGQITRMASSRPWLRLLPSRGRSDIARVFGAFDLFVLASRSTPTGEEQFGMVLAESMSAGVPIVGSSCGAIPEVVGDGGWIFPEGDTNALARLILQTIESPTELHEKSLAGRVRARACYSDSAVAGHLIRTWREALLKARG